MIMTYYIGSLSWWGERTKHLLELCFKQNFWKKQGERDTVFFFTINAERSQSLLEVIYIRMGFFRNEGMEGVGNLDFYKW